MFQGQTLREVAPPFLGDILIGAASGVGYGWFGQITDDELKKIGSSRLSELVQCGRIAIAREGGAENYTKNRSVAEKYKNLLKQ